MSRTRVALIGVIAGAVALAAGAVLAFHNFEAATASPPSIPVPSKIVVDGSCVSDPHVTAAVTCQAGTNRVVTIERLKDPSLVQTALCPPSTDCAARPMRRNGQTGWYVKTSDNNDTKSSIRWSYDGRPLVVTVTSAEPLDQLFSWWSNQNLSLTGG